ncbi:hypothetical protein, partial [Pseudomonas aeruginosa]|uniref:hypothetical protein n=1 Tax=Pseudomonas aeruginosa TaxID=287 RepID=UPI003982899C
MTALVPATPLARLSARQTVSFLLHHPPSPTNGYGPAPKGINDRKPPSIPPASYQQFFHKKLMKFTFQE